jgi:hypothetical protein
MISRLPKFEKGIDFCELDPEKSGNRYRYATNRTIRVKFKSPLFTDNKHYYFLDSKGKCWMMIFDNIITIKKGYAWNGCSPKIWFGIWWGTPDFEKTIFASLVHDILLQFHKTQHFPLKRDQIDHIFKEILKLSKFPLRAIYYFGVRLGTKFFPRHKYDAYSSLTCESWG